MQEILQQVMSVLRGMRLYRWYGLIAAWCLAVAGSVVLWKIPDQYEASARIFVDTDSILKPLMHGLAIQPNVDQQLAMLSRTLISRPNLERLIRMADLDLKADTKAEQERLIDHLQTHLEIKQAAGPNLYSMSYRDAEPEKARRVVQSMVSIFVESGMRASRKDTDSAKSFLDEQIRTVEGKLQEAETRLKDFRMRNIDRQFADGKDSAARIAEIVTQLDAARLQLREAERSRDSAKRQIADMRAQSAASTMPSLMAESALNVSTPDLDVRIETQKRSLDNLLQRYTDQHPDVVAARKLIADLEQQKRKAVQEAQKRMVATAAPNQGVQTTEALAMQELNRVLASSEVQVAAMQARVDEYSRRFAEAKQQMKTAPEIEAEATQLNRDYAITRKNYDELVARRQSAEMSSELDSASGVTEFRLIDPPRVAPRPVSPNRMVLFPLVVLAALGLGVGVAFAGTQLRPTFTDPDSLRLATGLPLLGVVTRVTSDAEIRSERMSRLRFVGASASLLVMTVIGVGVLFVKSRYGI